MVEVVIDSIRVSLMSPQRIVILKEMDLSDSFPFGSDRLKQMLSPSACRS